MKVLVFKVPFRHAGSDTCLLQRMQFPLNSMLHRIIYRLRCAKASANGDLGLNVIITVCTTAASREMGEMSLSYGMVEWRGSFLTTVRLPIAGYFAGKPRTLYGALFGVLLAIAQHHINLGH